MIKKIALFFILLLFLSGCRGTRDAKRSERHLQTVTAQRAYLRDSARNTYMLTVIRTYDTSTGALEKEELTQSGQTDHVREFLRDTVYVQRADTVYIEQHQQEYQGKGISEVGRIIVAVGGLLLAILVVYLAVRLYKWI